MPHPAWYFMTFVMPLSFTFCISLAIIQTKSLKWYAIEVADDAIFKNRRELFCLYGVYVMGASCAFQCFLCHLSNYFPDWYCYYGMSLCCIIYAATKSCLYGFFLERAKVLESNYKLLPKYVTQYIIPIYISSYFMVYVILCPLSFRGYVINPLTNTVIPTACLFGEYEEWVFILSATVDALNSVLFLFLFIYPLYNTVKRKENFQGSKDAQKLRVQLIATMKYNVICSIICMTSSVIFLIICAFGNSQTTIGYYLWLFGDIDNSINCFCVFLMVGANRRYIYSLYVTYVQNNSKSVENVNKLAKYQNDSKNDTMSTKKNNTASVCSTSPESDDIDVFGKIEIKDEHVKNKEEKRVADPEIA